MTPGKILRAASIAALALALAVLSPARPAEKDGGFVVYPGAPGPVLFSHRSHDGRHAGYACKDCHESAGGTMDVRMESIRRGEACGSCHNGMNKGPQSGATAAPIDACGSCHMPAGDIVIRLNRMDPVAFSHARHLHADSGEKHASPAGFSCTDCHPDPFERSSGAPVGMEVPHESGGCAVCHNGKKRKDGMPAAFAAGTRCLTCHKTPEP